jgi:hypothetical protein
MVVVAAEQRAADPGKGVVLAYNVGRVDWHKDKEVPDYADHFHKKTFLFPPKSFL